MKRVLFAGVITLTMFGVAYAREPNYSEVTVISVIPRSPDVKPIVMSLPAGGRRKQAEQNEIGDSQKLAVRNELAANTTTEKALSGTNGEKLLQKAPKQ
jgi:hypothetical protein